MIDGVWTTVGSTNLDWRSLLHNDELNAVVLGTDFAGQMEAAFQRDLANSSPSPRSLGARPIQDRARELAARLWEYWL